jgi:hypothetical protein
VDKSHFDSEKILPSPVTPSYTPAFSWLGWLGQPANPAGGSTGEVGRIQELRWK